MFSPNGQQRAWVVKATTDSLEQLIEEGVTKWRTKKPPKGWQPGDRLYFWQGSPTLELQAVGRLLSVEPAKRKGSNTFFHVRYETGLLDKPIGIEALRADRAVGEASFLKAGPAGTVYPLTPQQDVRLAKAIGKANRELKSWTAGFAKGEHGLNPYSVSLKPGREYRVLSIRPLWAWSIIFAGKDIENRSWQSPHRGPLLIHASGRKHTKRELAEFRQIIAECSGLPLELIPTEPPRSTMLGIVELEDIVGNAESPWAEEDCYHFVLKNPRFLDPALAPVHGKLNIWKWTAA